MKKIVSIMILLVMVGSITFAQDEVFSLSKYIGETFNIDESIENAVENYDDYVFTWTASNYETVNLFPDASATCIKDGKVQLIGYDELKKKRIYINLTVRNQVKGIDIGSDKIIVPNNSTLDLKTIFYYDYNEILRSKSLKWTYSNKTIAEVDKNGILTTFSEGSTYIIATSNDGGHKDYVKVVVEGDALSEKVEYLDEMQLGSEQRLSITSPGKLISNLSYNYVTSDESILSVSDTGQILAKNTGVAYITVSDSSYNRKVLPIKVNAAAKAVKINNEEIKFTSLNDKILLDYKVIYGNDIEEKYQIENIKFTSSSPYVAYVNDKGEIIPRSSGNTLITLSTNNGMTKDTVSVIVDVPLNDSVIYKFKFDSLPKKMYVGEVAKLDYTVKSVLSNPEFRFTLSKGSNKQIYDVNGTYYFKPEATGTVDINVKGPNGFSYKYPVVVVTKLSKIDLNSGLYTKENDGYRVYNGQDIVIEPNFIMSGKYSEDDLLNKSTILSYDDDYFVSSKDKNNLLSATKVGKSLLKITSVDYYKVYNTKLYVKSAISNFKISNNQVAKVGEKFRPALEYTYVHGLDHLYNENIKIELVSQSLPENDLDLEIEITNNEIEKLSKNMVENKLLINRLKSRKAKLLSMKLNSNNGYSTITGDLYGLDGRKVDVAYVYGNYIVAKRKGSIKIEVTLEDNGQTAFEQIEFN